MNTTEARRSISDEDFEIILDACWEQIALFAFEKYKENERGAVFLDRRGQDRARHRHPWRIYLFERLMQDEHEDAES
jgi:hypothetical protein